MTGAETEFIHISVLPDEVIKALAVKSDGKYVDGTLGGGGHASLICEKLTEKGLFIGIDRDKEAVAAAKQKLEKYKCRKIYAKRNYSDIKNILADNGINGIDGGLLDLGVSSYQLDNVERGFSYMKDAPLDMRMNADSSLTAEKVVNSYSEKDLTTLIRNYGEERWAARISKFIVDARKEKPIMTTWQLTDIIKAAIPAAARREGPHPAKRTFQAIRIEVNDELSPLEKTLEDFIDSLKPGGRLAVISFHSLEDRTVKDVFKRREDPCTCPKGFPTCVCGKIADIKRITRKPIVASKEELENNSRSRSAKLRVLQKL